MSASHIENIDYKPPGVKILATGRLLDFGECPFQRSRDMMNKEWQERQKRSRFAISFAGQGQQSMLERSQLILSCWERDPASNNRRLIFGGENTSGHALGAIDASRPSWFRRWAAGASFQIYETNDRALVFTVSPESWRATRWSVRDADQRLVGLLVHRKGKTHVRSLDELGRPLLDLSWSASSLSATANSIDGSWCADFDSAAGRTRISFAPAINPFVRMVVLGAALVGGW